MATTDANRLVQDALYIVHRAGKKPANMSWRTFSNQKIEEHLRSRSYHEHTNQKRTLVDADGMRRCIRRLCKEVGHNQYEREGKEDFSDAFFRTHSKGLSQLPSKILTKYNYNKKTTAEIESGLGKETAADEGEQEYEPSPTGKPSLLLSSKPSNLSTGQPSESQINGKQKARVPSTITGTSRQPMADQDSSAPREGPSNLTSNKAATQAQFPMKNSMIENFRRTTKGSESASVPPGSQKRKHNDADGAATKVNSSDQQHARKKVCASHVSGVNIPDRLTVPETTSESSPQVERSSELVNTSPRSQKRKRDEVNDAVADVESSERQPVRKFRIHGPKPHAEDAANGLSSSSKEHPRTAPSITKNPDTLPKVAAGPAQGSLASSALQQEKAKAAFQHAHPQNNGLPVDTEMIMDLETSHNADPNAELEPQQDFSIRDLKEEHATMVWHHKNHALGVLMTIGTNTTIRLPTPLDPNPSQQLQKLHARCWGENWREARHKMTHAYQRSVFSEREVAMSLISAFIFDNVLNQEESIEVIRERLHEVGLPAAAREEILHCLQKERNKPDYEEATRALHTKRAREVLAKGDVAVRNQLKAEAEQFAKTLWLIIAPHFRAVSRQAEGLGSSSGEPEEAWQELFDTRYTRLIEEVLHYRLKLHASGYKYAWIWPEYGQEFHAGFIDIDGGGDLEEAMGRPTLMTTFPGVTVQFPDPNDGEYTVRASAKIHTVKKS